MADPRIFNTNGGRPLERGVNNTDRIAVLERGGGTGGGGGGGTVADASASVKGKLQLAGDLAPGPSGAADPIVVGSLTSKPKWGSMGFGTDAITTNWGTSASDVGRDLVFFGSGSIFSNAGIGLQWSDYAQTYDYDGAIQIIRNPPNTNPPLYNRRSNLRNDWTGRGSGQVSTGGFLANFTQVHDKTGVQSVALTSIDASGNVVSASQTFVVGERILIYGTTDTANHDKAWQVIARTDATHFQIGVQGKVFNYGTTPGGITQSYTSGTMTLQIANGLDFYSSGTVTIGGFSYTYSARTQSTMTITSGTAQTFTDGQAITQVPTGAGSTGGHANNAPFMFCYSGTVFPLVARSVITPGAASTNGDDIACYGANNGGTARGTDAYYVGRSASVTGSGWMTTFTCDSDVDFGFHVGSVTVGADNSLGEYAGQEYGAAFNCAGATFASGAHAIRLPNQGYTAGGALFARIYSPSVGGSNYRQLIGLNSTNAIQISSDRANIGVFGSQVVTPTNTNGLCMQILGNFTGTTENIPELKLLAIAGPGALSPDQSSRSDLTMYGYAANGTTLHQSKFRTDGVNGLLIGTVTSLPFVFNVAGTEAMRISNADSTLRLNGTKLGFESSVAPAARITLPTSTTDTDGIQLGTSNPVTIWRTGNRQLRVGDTTRDASFNLNWTGAIASSSDNASSGKLYVAMNETTSFSIGRTAGTVFRVFKMLTTGPQPANAILEISAGAGSLAWGDGTNATDNLLSRVNSTTMGFDKNLQVGNAVKMVSTGGAAGVHFVANTTGTLVSTGTSEAVIYLKGNNLVVKFNDGGTTRYKSLDLSGTGVTWAHATTEP